MAEGSGTEQERGPESSDVPRQPQVDARLPPCFASLTSPSLSAISSFLQPESQPSVAGLVDALAPAMVYTDAPNAVTNRKLWDAYAAAWDPSADFVKKMSSSLPPGGASIHRVGDEWSDVESFQEVLRDWILPHADNAIVAEIGSGGGRVAVELSRVAQRLECFDISQNMLSRASAAVASVEGACAASFHKLEIDSSGRTKFPSCEAQFDFVVVFDVLVHMDLHSTWHTLQQVRRMLKQGGRAFLSVASIETPLGWERFAKQSHFSVGGFYFMGKQNLATMLDRAGLRAVAWSSPSTETENVYFNRDVLVLVEAPV
mmetsp:Transcript_30511/g.78965  ORF Transcript_30511/g.78965 Transcript_30511/m.78965 type:complete len:316 (+) Transcript_30511:611-1558(+)